MSITSGFQLGGELHGFEAVDGFVPTTRWPLSALSDHERISFAPSASPTAAVDWFRALREIEHRLNEAGARTQCSINQHRPDPPRTWQTDQSQWQTFIDADIRGREQQVIHEDLRGR